MCLCVNRKKSTKNSLFFDNYRKLISFRKFVFFVQTSMNNFFEKISKKVFLELEKSFYSKV